MASIETIVWHYFCYFVIQWCTSIHHLTGYSSTLYRLTRNHSTTMIYHLARDLDVSRKLSCVLLNLTNKTFSCNALFPSINVFFKAEQFIAKSLSLSFSWHPKDFLTMQFSLSLPYVGIRPDCPAWEQLSSVFGLVLRRKEASLSSTERLSFNQPGRSVICPCDEAGSGKSRHCSFWKAAREGLLIEQQYQVLAVIFPCCVL